MDSTRRGGNDVSGPSFLNRSHLLRSRGSASPSAGEIDRILEAIISDPVGPEFMAPPARRMAA
jgi:hypothetical protein